MRRALILMLLCALAGPAPAKKRPAKIPADPKAQEVFDRTKNVRAAYALYDWNWRRGDDGRVSLHWSAEFHRGSSHRMETPDLRAVADCSTRKGTLLEIRSGLTQSHAWIANAICGIRSDKIIYGLEWVGRKDSRFGPVDTIRVTDLLNERLYTVDEVGIIVATEYFSRDAALKGCVQTEPVSIEKELPAADIFAVESLERSFVPEKYQKGPETPAGDLWSGSRRCV
ncbi:MAG TPA: hypothetical protein VF688_11035 [Allosphingosinicella sp.]